MRKMFAEVRGDSIRGKENNGTSGKKDKEEKCEGSDKEGRDK